MDTERRIRRLQRELEDAIEDEDKESEAAIRFAIAVLRGDEWTDEAYDQAKDEGWLKRR